MECGLVAFISADPTGSIVWLATVFVAFLWCQDRSGGECVAVVSDLAAMELVDGGFLLSL